MGEGTAREGRRRWGRAWHGGRGGSTGGLACLTGKGDKQDGFSCSPRWFLDDGARLPGLRGPTRSHLFVSFQEQLDGTVTYAESAPAPCLRSGIVPELLVEVVEAVVGAGAAVR